MPHEQREIAVRVCLDAEKPAVAPEIDIGPRAYAGRCWVHGDPVQRDELAPSEDRKILDARARPSRYVVRDVGADEIRRESNLGGCWLDGLDLSVVRSYSGSEDQNPRVLRGRQSRYLSRLPARRRDSIR